jgi:hypothetical protein
MSPTDSQKIENCHLRKNRSGLRARKIEHCRIPDADGRNDERAIPPSPGLRSDDESLFPAVLAHYPRDIPRTALCCFAQFWQSLTGSMEIASYAYDVGVFRVEYEEQET